MGIARLKRVLGRLIGAALLLWALGLVAVGLWTFLWPMDRPMPQGDAIICLGAGVDGAGRIDAAGLKRAEACAGLARAGAAPVVIFTGGPAATGGPSAAAGMAEVAQTAGVGQSLVIIEPVAQSTLQNAAFSLALLSPEARLILVSEAFHLPRAWASFRAMGAEDLALYPSERLRRGQDGAPAWGMLLRESVAIWFNAARFAAWSLGGMMGMDAASRIGWLR